MLIGVETMAVCGPHAHIVDGQLKSLFKSLRA